MIRFVGDINLTDWDFNFGFGIGSRIEQGFNPLATVKKHDEDLWVGNFEGVASSITDKKGMASKIFRVNPDSLRQITLFDYFGVANNHVMQHGAGAFQQTVDSLLKNGCRVFGHNNRRSEFFEYKGKRISVTGCSFRIDEFENTPLYWHNPEYYDILGELNQIPGDVFKVLYVHWGNEFINYPSSQQKRFAHWLIDAGFDLIIGMHPHVIQGYEDYKGKRIYYSLGNFVFDMPWTPCRYGAIIGLDFKGKVPLYTHDYIFIDNTCTPSIVSFKKVPEQYQFEFLNRQLLKEVNTEDYHREISIQYKKYRSINRFNVIRNALKHPAFGLNVILDFFKRRFCL